MRLLNLFVPLLFSIAILTIRPDILLGQTDFVGEDPALAAWEVGNRKEVVIVLHGGPCAEHTYLRPEFDRLEKWARVVYYDQRGCGKSEQADLYVWQEHVKDLRKIIQHFAPNQKVFLAGSSWGSALGLLYAYEHPDDLKGLILSGLFKWEGEGEDISRYLGLKRQRRAIEHHPDSKEHVLTEHQIQIETKDDGSESQVIVEIEKVAHIGFGPPHSQTRRSLVSAPVFEELAKIKTPLIIFNGTRSCGWVSQVRKYQEVFPDAPYVEVLEACHDPWFADPAFFFEECRLFIRRNKRKSKRKKDLRRQLK